MKEAILKAKKQGDSVGESLNAQYRPFTRYWFSSLNPQSRISSMMFSIPAVKGLNLAAALILQVRGSQPMILLQYKGTKL